MNTLHMKAFIRLVGLFLVVLSVVGGMPATPTLAAPSTQRPSKIHYERFQKVERTTLAKLRTEAAQGIVRHSILVNSPQASAADSCLTFTYGVNGRTATGTWMFSFAQRVSWCYNGSKVTFHSYQYLPQGSLDWQYKEVISESHQEGPNAAFWQDNATAKFSKCYPAVGCIEDSFPWVNITVHANGTYSGAGGGAKGS